ncbi:MAG TPA: hypothetical protein PKD99_15750 [Sphingopyxis sp.]|nr:hypothetical protein [Sphingopyxis sp.]HMP46553.1 hypothetical protein [Sphingopyxis sp.]
MPSRLSRYAAALALTLAASASPATPAAAEDIHQQLITAYELELRCRQRNYLEQVWLRRAIDIARTGSAEEARLRAARNSPHPGAARSEYLAIRRETKAAADALDCATDGGELSRAAAVLAWGLSGAVVSSAEQAADRGTLAHSVFGLNSDERMLIALWRQAANQMFGANVAALQQSVRDNGPRLQRQWAGGGDSYFRADTQRLFGPLAVWRLASGAGWQARELRLGEEYGVGLWKAGAARPHFVIIDGWRGLTIPAAKAGTHHSAQGGVARTADGALVVMISHIDPAVAAPPLRALLYGPHSSPVAATVMAKDCPTTLCFRFAADTVADAIVKADHFRVFVTAGARDRPDKESLETLYFLSERAREATAAMRM